MVPINTAYNMETRTHAKNRVFDWVDGLPGSAAVDVLQMEFAHCKVTACCHKTPGVPGDPAHITMCCAGWVTQAHFRCDNGEYIVGGNLWDGWQPGNGLTDPARPWTWWNGVRNIPVPGRGRRRIGEEAPKEDP